MPTKIVGEEDVPPLREDSNGDDDTHATAIAWSAEK